MTTKKKLKLPKPTYAVGARLLIHGAFTKRGEPFTARVVKHSGGSTMRVEDAGGAHHTIRTMHLHDASDKPKLPPGYAMVFGKVKKINAKGKRAGIAKLKK